nr:MAG TPA: hypothetical protein [Caudoviricetes sp.]
MIRFSNLYRFTYDEISILIKNERRIKNENNKFL